MHFRDEFLCSTMWSVYGPPAETVYRFSICIGSYCIIQDKCAKFFSVLRFFSSPLAKQVLLNMDLFTGRNKFGKRVLFKLNA